MAKKATAGTSTSNKKNTRPAKGKQASGVSPNNASKKKRQTSSQQALNERNKRQQRCVRRRYGMMLAALIVVIGGIVGYQMRLGQRTAAWLHSLWLESTASAGFTFRELVVKGRHLTPPQQVVDAVGLTVGDSLFLVSLEDIRQRLMALETVNDASVTRDMTGHITVTLKERVPFALWQHEDTLEVIDRDGVTLSQLDPDDYPYLVTVVGEHAPKRMAELTELLTTNTALAEQVVAAVLVSQRRWDIHLSNDVQVLLPEDNIGAAWDELARLNREYQLLEQRIEAIDLRIEGRVFVTLQDQLQQQELLANDV